MLNPTPLASLWDMLKNYGFIYSSIVSDLGQWRKRFIKQVKEHGKDADLEPDGARLAAYMSIIRRECAPLGLDVALAQIDRIEKLAWRNAPAREAVHELNELRRRSGVSGLTEKATRAAG